MTYTSNFDWLLAELSKAQRARELRAEATPTVTTRAPKKTMTLKKSLQELMQLGKSIRRQRIAEEKERGRAARSKFFELKDKAAEMYKAGYLSAEDLCRFEVHWNRMEHRFYPRKEQRK